MNRPNDPPRLPSLFRRGRSPKRPRVLADFPGGSVEGARVLSPEHLRFSARADSSPRPLWFYFEIRDTDAPAVRCDLVNADECLGPRLGWRTARPVFSADGQAWERVVRTEYVEKSAASGYFSFTVPIVGQSTRVAYCYPYAAEDLAARLDAFPEGTGPRREELCRSPEGRPVAHLRLGNHETPRRSAWVLARQHAGETPASFTAEGILEALAREPLPSLADTAYHVFPLLDVDGVFHGRYGKDQSPVDFNRDWRDAPSRREVAALVELIRREHAAGAPGLVLDLHAPHHGDAACYAFGLSAAAGEEEACRRQDFLIRRLAAESPRAVAFRETDLRAGYCPERSARDYLWNTFRIQTLTLEVSYHLAQSGEYLTPHHYHAFGSAVARAMDRYFCAPAAAFL